MRTIVIPADDIDPTLLDVRRHVRTLLAEMRAELAVLECSGATPAAAGGYRMALERVERWAGEWVGGEL